MTGAAKFDKSKPYGECCGAYAAKFYQAGHYFDVNGVEVSEDGAPLVSDVAVASEEKPKDRAKSKKNRAKSDTDGASSGSSNRRAEALAEWRALKEKSRAAGGPTSNKAAILEFLAGQQVG